VPAAVELALIAPLLIVALACVIDGSRLALAKLQARGAAQAGAEYAVRQGWDAAAIASAVTSAGSAVVTANPAPVRSTGCVANGVIVATASPTCPGGGLLGTYVRVSAQQAFTPILPWSGLAAPVTVASSAMVRIQ
jgi:Flp pilus assembly protein TadG